MRSSGTVLASYDDFAAALVAEGIVKDPWVDGEPRFRMTPVLLDRPTQASLYAAAEAVAAVHAAGAELCAREPALVARHFDLPPSYERMWRASAPAWHGIARADVFLTEDGPRVCELNSDTPSGEPEAVTLNRLVDGAGACAFDDPNCRLGDAVFEMVRAVAPPGPLTIGLVYPTEITEDLSVIELYARWFEARGARVVLGSPFNLRPDGRGGVAMFGVSCTVVWRHYKTDWWGERRTVWRSEDEYADAAPLSEPLEWLAAGVARGRVAVVNPFGAVLTQNKRMMALLWEELPRLPRWARRLVRRYLPPTARLETLERARLRAERAQWVLKSDYGCEGEEVVIGAETSAAAWARAIDDAIPRRWIAQRRFVPLRNAAGEVANHGVYVVGGRAAGLFTRLQIGATDRRAVTAPTIVDGGVTLARARRS
ncbi:MAG TPA: glutathionylspermidine synthase family protein [Polyangia bacterium]|nr:glutathionylspermidine synthase family protein [Polyangia bacterium]